MSSSKTILAITISPLVTLMADVSASNTLNFRLRVSTEDAAGAPVHQNVHLSSADAAVLVEMLKIPRPSAD